MVSATTTARDRIPLFSCQACGSVDRFLDHRYWSCIRPLIIEAFSVLVRPPDLWIWIFGSGLEDDDLAILASAKSIIYRYFVQPQNARRNYGTTGRANIHGTLPNIKIGFPCTTILAQRR
ncbi:hypothetical protein LAZ67_3005624 [Cordylochernes scorpioides]|uniref:Uncharacterized protein n=1 Tax=Cordylochernes scorpioides TaxID=51811 RepID=A0ABY6KAJ2_9ARAC|nr:hypothetical protein LAZ67_3005624 [Cordylochernes scorpioides]